MLTSFNTPFGSIKVWQQGSVRDLYLDNDTVIQSQLDVTQKEKLQLQYTRAMMSFLLFRSNPESFLLLGLGGGSIIHFLSHWFPKLQMTAVDINETIVDIANEYFEIESLKNLNIHIADASTYLTKSQQKNLSVIMLDLHDGKHSVDFLYSNHFQQQCFDALSAEGVLVINLLTDSSQDFLKLMTALRQSFTGISICMSLKEQKNTLLFAFKSLDKLDMDQLHIKAKQYQEKFGIEFVEFVEQVSMIGAKDSVLEA